MHWCRANHANMLFSPDLYDLAQQGTRVKAANRFKLAGAVAVNVGHDQPHLVHVGIHHHAQIGATIPFFESQQITQRIHSPLIHMVGNEVTQQQPHLFFIACHAGGFG